MDKNQIITAEITVVVFIVRDKHTFNSINYFHFHFHLLKNKNLKTVCKVECRGNNSLKYDVGDEKSMKFIDIFLMK